MATKAIIGDKIQWIDPKTSIELSGNVYKVYENSVLVNISNNANLNSIDMYEKTVVSHKRYQIIN